MKISNRAIVGSVGIVVIGLVSLLLKSGGCLWALFLLVLILETVED